MRCVVSLPQLLRPIPQREFAQWEVGVGHAEDAHLMSREGRIESYTFIYVDKEPETTPPLGPAKGRAARPARRPSRGSRGSGDSRGGQHTPPRRQQPRRQCSATDTGEPEPGPTSPKQEGEGEELKPTVPASSPPPEPEPRPQSPPVKTAWKTAAARKLLPLSITMKRLNVEITKCDWTLYREKAPSSPKPKVPEREGKQADPVRHSPRVRLPLARLSRPSLTVSSCFVFTVCRKAWRVI